MDYVLFIVAIIVLIVGLVGDIVPGIPGTIVSYLAMLIVHWTEKASFTTSELVVFGIACAIITVLDYIVPVWGTKKFGGTKAGVRGSTIGLIIGIIGLPMLGITIGPFGLLRSGSAIGD